MIPQHHRPDFPVDAGLRIHGAPFFFASQQHTHHNSCSFDLDHFFIFQRHYERPTRTIKTSHTFFSCVKRTRTLPRQSSGCAQSQIPTVLGYLGGLKPRLFPCPGIVPVTRRWAPSRGRSWILSRIAELPLLHPASPEARYTYTTGNIIPPPPPPPPLSLTLTHTPLPPGCTQAQASRLESDV